jgi:hypothetical protein
MGFMARHSFKKLMGTRMRAEGEAKLANEKNFLHVAASLAAHDGSLCRSKSRS